MLNLPSAGIQCFIIFRCCGQGAAVRIKDCFDGSVNAVDGFDMGFDYYKEEELK